MIKNELIKQIKKKDAGISLEKFIDISLFNKNGYYIQSNPIGKSGDFITAPEISQLFGEIIGLYIYDIWKKKFDNKINLIEIGPGNVLSGLAKRSMKGVIINQISNASDLGY